jgi:signal peptidase
MKFFTPIMHILTYLGLVAFVMLAILLLGSITPLGSYQVRVVESGSMEPTFSTGSAILTKLATAYAIGDVVTFQRRADSSATTHRIIAIEDGLYTMQGDANNTADLIPVEESEIAGVVFLQIPFLGYVLNFAQQPLGFLLLVGVPALLIVIEQVKRIVAVVRRKNEEEANKTAV